MTWWIVWLVVIGIALILGLIGSWFSLRTLRWCTGVTAVVLVVVLTRYGLTHPAKTPSDLVDSFERGVNAVIIALLHPLWHTHMVPAPGVTDRWIIAAALLLGYRQLEAWSLRWQAPELDMSSIGQAQPAVPPQDTTGTSAGRDTAAAAPGPTDAQQHAELAAELRFRLPAMEIRSPAILPGGTRTNALASIAEASGVSGAGIVSAAFQLAGMFWPAQGQVRARVWIEPATEGSPGCRVTVLLDNARTGLTVATKTVVGNDLQEAASMVAGYIARQIFAMDRSVPTWCYGVADGRDLGAMQLARMERVYAARSRDVERSRKRQIDILRKATGNVRSAGVVRYELSQLCALAEEQLESLRLHAINRELHPRLYRGRYRFAMTIEMITGQDYCLPATAGQEEKLGQILEILARCGLTGDERLPVRFEHKAAGLAVSPELSKKLLDVAAEELSAVRRQLALASVVRDALFRRDERPVWLPHWQQRHRETFQDGVSVAELFIAIRQRLLERDHPELAGRAGPPQKIPRHLRQAIKIVSFIAGDRKYLTELLLLRPSDPWPVRSPGVSARSGTGTDRNRWLPWQRRTASWQAAYNAACLYAALAVHPEQPQVTTLEEWVIDCLRRAVDNPGSELDRPSDWISHDPDFRPLYRDPAKYQAFARFLDEQKRQDYPQEQTAGTTAGQSTGSGTAAVSGSTGPEPGPAAVLARHPAAAPGPVAAGPVPAGQ